MKNRLIPCVLACLMIFLVGCSGNTAKEAAQEITKTETSLFRSFAYAILNIKKQKSFDLLERIKALLCTVFFS